MRGGRADAAALLSSALLATAAFFLTGEVLAWVGVLAAGLGLWAVWRAPVRTTLLVMAFFALAVDNPHERPANGLWESALYPLAKLYFVNLHQSLPVPFLRFSVLEFLIVFLFLVVLVRRARGSGEDPPPLSSPRPLRQALLLSALAIVVLLVWGLLRGGDLKQSLFQSRVMLALPAAAYLFLYGLRGEKDLRALGRIVVLAAFAKVAMSLYFVFVVCRPQGIVPPYATTHTDTVLYVVALMIVITRWWERPSGLAMVEGAVIGAVLLVGVVLNDRRLAYVSLLECLVAMVALSPWNRARRFLVRVAVVSLPLVLAYVVVGWTSASPIFKPVRDLRSVVVSDTDTSEDESTRFRDIENYNLIFTWARNPVLGAGFGHEWEEEVRLPDISRWMSTYHYQPHNGVLWLWTIGGLLGFSALWLFLAVGVYVIARAYHAAAPPRVRAAMLVALSAVVAFLNQVFGDMGTQSYTSVFTVAPALALAGQVVVAAGGWRERAAPGAVAPAQGPA